MSMPYQHQVRRASYDRGVRDPEYRRPSPYKPPPSPHSARQYPRDEDDSYFPDNKFIGRRHPTAPPAYNSNYDDYDDAPPPAPRSPRRFASPSTNHPRRPPPAYDRGWRDQEARAATPPLYGSMPQRPPPSWEESRADWRDDDYGAPQPRQGWGGGPTPAYDRDRPPRSRSPYNQSRYGYDEPPAYSDYPPPRYAPDSARGRGRESPSPYAPPPPPSEDEWDDDLRDDRRGGWSDGAAFCSQVWDPYFKAVQRSSQRDSGNGDYVSQGYVESLMDVQRCLLPIWATYARKDQMKLSWDEFRELLRGYSFATKGKWEPALTDLAVRQYLRTMVKMDPSRDPDARWNMEQQVYPFIKHMVRITYPQALAALGDNEKLQKRVWKGLHPSRLKNAVTRDHFLQHFHAVLTQVMHEYGQSYFQTAITSGMAPPQMGQYPNGNDYAEY